MKNTLEIFVRTETESLVSLKKEIDFIPSVGLIVKDGDTEFTITKVTFENGYQAVSESLNTFDTEDELKELGKQGWKKSKEEKVSEVKETPKVEPVKEEVKQVLSDPKTEVKK